ncbi:hypothetical protein LWC05_05605 [Acetobacter sicerae]|uniref:Uncharacterized protein n=1 Tax=Acetobacter sicerae TaxID=85325 RepID=A0ABS8VXT9_9PROT|nr:hypothetical protein [Acetobacter sicerae]
MTRDPFPVGSPVDETRNFSDIRSSLVIFRTRGVSINIPAVTILEKVLFPFPDTLRIVSLADAESAFLKAMKGIKTFPSPLT